MLMNNQNTGNNKFRASVRKDRDNNSYVDPLKLPSRSPMFWKEDGVDHINIGHAAKTEIGKALNHSSMITLNHSKFGKFSSIQSFWHYIQSEERDDRIRTLTGQMLMKFIKNLTTTRVVNFRAIILDANYQRIIQHDRFLNDLKESELPLDCYFVNESGVRIRPPYFKWLNIGLEEIRLALKEDREPDFKRFMDRPDVDIYHFVLPGSSK